MLEYLHVECAPPLVQFTPYRALGRKVVSLCTDDDILIEVILSIYIFPENPWILETPSPLKALVNKGNPLSLGPLKH